MLAVNPTHPSANRPRAPRGDRPPYVEEMHSGTHTHTQAHLPKDNLSIAPMAQAAARTGRAGGGRVQLNKKAVQHRTHIMLRWPLNLAQQQPTQALRTESFWLGLYCSIAEANTHHTARGGRQSTSPGWVGGNFLMYKIGTLQQQLTSRSTHDQLFSAATAATVRARCIG